MFFLHYASVTINKLHREEGATKNSEQSWKAIDLAKVQVSLGTMWDEKNLGVTRIQL